MKNEQDFLNAVIREDTGAWFETHGKIWSKDRTQGVVKPRQNFLQHKIQMVVSRLEEEGLPVRIVSLKPRARGSTTYFTALGYTLMRRTSTSAVFIGGQSDQTVGLWTMMKTYHANDKFDWKNTGEVNEKGAQFSNGSRAKKETAKDIQAGIGDTYTLLHATEAARWSKYGVANAGGVMSNILKAVPLLPKTYVFLESTAEGASGPFYTRFIGAVDADEFLSGSVSVSTGSFVRIFAPWFQFMDSVIRLTPEGKEHIKKTMDDEDEYSGERELIELYKYTDEDGVDHLGESVTGYDIWEQLAWRRWSIKEECERDKNIFDRDYPHSWKVAFQKSGNIRFNSTGLRVQRRGLRLRPPPQYGIIQETKEKKYTFLQTSKGEAKVIIYEKPISGRKYILSLDPMTGASQVAGLDPDRHGIFVLRDGYWDGKGAWHKPATVARIVQCRWDVGVTEPEVWALAKMYGPGSGCMIIIEMNKDAGFTELLKKRNANLYQREIFDQREQKTSKSLGFQTTERTREMLIETMATAIRSWDVPGGGIDIWDSDALDQFDNFVRKDNGRSEAGENWHDDDVFAIALAVTVIGHATTYVPPTASTWFEPPSERRGAPQVPGAFS